MNKAVIIAAVLSVFGVIGHGVGNAMAHAESGACERAGYHASWYVPNNPTATRPDYMKVFQCLDDNDQTIK